MGNEIWFIFEIVIYSTKNVKYSLQTFVLILLYIFS